MAKIGYFAQNSFLPNADNHIFFTGIAGMKTETLAKQDITFR